MANTEDLGEETIQQELEDFFQFCQQGNISKAQEFAYQLLKKYPENYNITQKIGILYLQLNQPSKALDYFYQSIKQQPQQAMSYHYAGIALCQLGNLDEGIKYYVHAIKYDSKLYDVYVNLGIAFLEKNEITRAQKFFEIALKNNIKSPVLFYNLAFIEHQQKSLPLAISYYEKALSLNPQYIKCAINLGEALFEANRIEESHKIFSQLVTILPNDKNVQKKLGVTYFKLMDFEKSVEHLQKAFDQTEEDIFIYLASAYAQLKDVNKQYDTLLLGLQNFPNNPSILISLINLCRMNCIWEKHADLLIHLKTLIPNEDYLFKYPFYYILGLNLEEEIILARRIANYYKSKLANEKIQCNFIFNAKKKSTLKIGYMTGNLRNHPNAHMIMNLFTYHSRDGFEYFLYATDKPQKCIYVDRIVETVDHFVDLSEMHYKQAAQAIYQNKIDILVDLTGYHHVFSSQILALHPASLTIGFLDHCGSRGADYIDYIFLDNVVTLAQEIPFYEEKLIFMPNTHFITNDQQTIAPACSQATFNLPTDKFILTCFNHVLKYEPRSFSSWMRILTKIPDAILLLWGQEVENQLKNYAKQQGIDPDRIIFADTLEKSMHLARLQTLDLFIDTFECSAHSTAIDALWAGLPMVTLYGHNVAMRGASSILSAHGMDELITYSIEEYEAKIIELASDKNKLASIKAKILANKKTSPLFNTKLFTTQLEKAYFLVYENFLLGKEKEHIVL